MGSLHQMLMDTIIDSLKEKDGEVDSEKIISSIEKMTLDLGPRVANEILLALKTSAPKMLEDRRLSDKGFVERNNDRWSNGFDLLEMLIATCIELGETFNAEHRPLAVKEGDIVFEVIVRLHARACHISSEILCLLKNGFADGAHARWRALHEVAVTAAFIGKHGKEAALKYYHHEIVDSYKGMRQHNKYAHRLNVQPVSDEELETHKKLYDSALRKYGKNFGTQYGWAIPFVKGTRPSFAQIEENVNLDHMRPYFKWASQNIHAGMKSVTNILGLQEASEEMLLVGRSDAGMADPAHSTSISLTLATSVLGVVKPSFDAIVMGKIILKISDEIGQAFLKSDTCEVSVD